MLNTIETCGCAKCYTVIQTGCGKRLAPWVLQAGHTGRQSRTAYLFFDVGDRGCFEPQSACLRVFVCSAQLCGRHETVCIHPVLPCGAPMPVEAKAAFEVERHFCGWKTADISPVYKAVGQELCDAPFGLALSVPASSLVTFSVEPAARPRLVLDGPDVPCGGESMGENCPCAGTMDICAPVTCGYCTGCGSGVRVESRAWDIEFEREDSSVLRRVDRMKQGTFFVTNTGEGDILATVETGFDASRWAYDTQRKVAPGETQAIVAKFFGRYYRITLTTEGAGRATVEFIGQYYTRP